MLLMTSNAQATLIGCDVGDVTLDLINGASVNSLYCENYDGNDTNVLGDEWVLIDKMENIDGYFGDWSFADYLLDDPFVIVLKSSTVLASYFFDYDYNTSSGTYIVDGLFDDKLQDISHISLYSNEQINEVPIPGSIWLFGTGLIGLIGFRNRQGKTN